MELSQDSLWFKDAVIYELHVRAFQDSNNDGRGDFRGLIERLDYLQDLGITAIWILPFYPSPWRDDGYDIASYTTIHPAYGDMKDFQAFVKEAHRRGLRVITELVVNHTSDQHPWFQRSRRAKPGSRWRDFYVWSDTPDKYNDARIIFRDFETSNWSWDPIAKAYYWHRFFSHQPDLNFDNPLVRRAIQRVTDFWIDQGVDGFRLDAIPYLFEREGTNCENLSETHSYLQELRAHVDKKCPGIMLLAEANMWPEDAVRYFGDGNECHMSFHFPLMPRMFTAIRMEDRFPIVEILRQTPAIPENCQWALFLRNHDELTLEMVTDEERDYMYRVYAHDPQMRINLGIRRRLAPLLENDRRRIELMNFLLFSLPGTPVLYYGDEIGMGDNVYLGDRNGVRTPMQWSADRNAGFSRTNPQGLYLPIIIAPEYHYESVNVEVQQGNPHSLFWWTKHLIAMRKQVKAFGRGTLEFLHPDNRRILAFIRRYEDEIVLVIANLSRFVQAASLDLCALHGMTPVEMFGKSELPIVGDSPYLITMGPYEVYWLSLEKRATEVEALESGAPPVSVPMVEVSSWEEVFQGSTVETLEAYLPGFLQSRRWFRTSNRRISRITLKDAIQVPGTSAYILMTEVIYDTDEHEIYTLLGAIAVGKDMEELRQREPEAVAFHLKTKSGEEGILYSALWDRKFASTLLEAIKRRRRLKGAKGEIVAYRTRALAEAEGPSEPTLLRTEQDNNSFAFGTDYILKIFRRTEPGRNPEVDLGLFLNDRSQQLRAAPLAGYLEYRSPGEQPVDLAVLHTFIPNEGNLWQYTLDALGQYFDRARLDRQEIPADLRVDEDLHPLERVRREPPPLAGEWIATFRETARLLGERTADMHLALATGADPAFAPEPFTDFYRLGLYHGILSDTSRALEILRDFTRRGLLRGSGFQDVVSAEENIREKLRPFRDSKFYCQRIRVHGHFELAQVLYTGKDVVLVDFEGNPSKSLNERALKRSCLLDVVSMLLSFRQASMGASAGLVPGFIPRPEDSAVTDLRERFWYRWVSAAFLRGYLDKVADSELVPKQPEALRVLFDALKTEAAMARILRVNERNRQREELALRAAISLLP